MEGGGVFEFSQYENGLYYFDTNDTVSNSKPKVDLHYYSLLSTVSENKTYFLAQEIKGADLSRKFQEYLFFPGPSIFKIYVNENLINNCEITGDNINREELIYGPLEPYIGGHMVRHKPPIHDKIEKIPLPSMIGAHHTNLALCMFFSLLLERFFPTKSEKVNFLTAQFLRIQITAHHHYSIGESN